MYFILVTIKRLHMPILATRFTTSFKDSVTIVTKTFLRYKCLERFLDSVNRFYPGIQVIVADDSPDEDYKRIDTFKYPFVKQHRMPKGAGFFAGRALGMVEIKKNIFLFIE